VAKIIGKPEALGGLAAFGLQLEAAGEVTERDDAARQVAVGVRAERRVRLDRDGQGLLEVGGPASVAAVGPRAADGRVRPCQQAAEVKLIGEGERLPSHPDRFLVPPALHEAAGEVDERKHLGVRRLGSFEECCGSSTVLQALLTLALPPGQLTEQRLGLGGRL
jgi:hypothetical protein